MSEYYAVHRSGDSLAHYGVRGMKWGVKKALAKGSERKMDCVYRKAQKKLNKLKRNADINVQNAKVSVQGRKAIRSGLVTAGFGASTALGINGLKKHMENGDLRFSQQISYGGPAYKGLKKNPLTGKAGSGPMGVSLSKDAARTAAHTGASGLATLAGLGKTAYHVTKAAKAKYRTTKKGHAKAVAKAQSWQNEMNKVFAGTKYGSKSKKRRASTRG